MKICAGVVLYNPSVHFSDYISNYIDQVSYVIVYDNSPLNTHEEHKKCLLEKFGTKVIWLNTDGYNHGISCALNKIFDSAIQHGYDYCITFDQDSYLEGEMVELMCESIEHNQDQTVTAMYSPNYLGATNFNKLGLIEVYEAITAGAFVNLQYVRQYGGYNEEYFIYVCDYEFCWRARNNGYKIFLNPAVHIKHQMDDDRNSFKSKYACYYAIRNNLRLAKDYSSIFPQEAKNRRKKGLEMWLYMAWKPKMGVKKKLDRIVYVLRAFVDFSIGKQGSIM